MTTFTRPQVVADTLQSQGTTNHMSHTSVAITVTATMTQGSLLDAAGAEIASALGVANAVFAIDDLSFHEAGLEVGVATEVSVVKANALIIRESLQYADTAVPELAELATSGFQNCQYV